MPDWSSLGGDPAPGSPTSIIKTGAAECRRIAEAARDARNEFARIEFRFASAIWDGDAADRFSRSLPTVVDDLSKLQMSYEAVANALETYAGKLTAEQEFALVVLGKAVAAQSDAATAKSGLSEAESHQSVAQHDEQQARTLSDAKKAAAHALTLQRLQLEQKVVQATDPTQKFNYQQQLTSTVNQQAAAQSAFSQASATLTEAQRRLVDADGEVTTRRSSLAEAQQRDATAQGLADDIRSTVRRAAHLAADEIRTAKSTTVGTGWDKFRHRVRESKAFKFILDQLDLALDYLNKVSLVCEILALIPGLNAVFGPIALMLSIATTILGAAQLLMKLVDGRSTGWSLAGSALMVAVGILGIKGNVADLKGGLAIAKKLDSVSAAIKYGNESAALGSKALQQASRDFKMMRRGTLGAAGEQRLRMTVFKRTVGGTPGTGDLKAIGESQILNSVARGKVKPIDFANSYLGKRTVKSGSQVYKATKHGIDLANQDRPRSPQEQQHADQFKVVKGAWKLRKYIPHKKAG